MNDQMVHRNRSSANKLRLTIATLLAVVVGAAVVVYHAASGATSRQYGVNVYVTDNCYQSAKAWRATATNEMNSVRSLRATSVALAFPFYMTKYTASSVFTRNQCPAPRPQRNSPSRTRLAVLVRAAHAVGLRVVLRPLLDEAGLGKWRGAIAPRNEGAWFTSYKRVLQPYLQMAKRNRVEQFGISGELNSLSNSKYWPSLIQFARHLYPGQLLFTSTWPRGTTRHPSGTSSGVDAYPAVRHAKPSASVAELLAGWDSALHDTKLGGGSTLYEVGIKAVNGAYRSPSNYTRPHATFNEQIQANWFTAACQFAKSHELGGIYIWGPDLRFNHGKLLTKPNPKKASQLQPAAQTVIRACFSEGD